MKVTQIGEYAWKLTRLGLINCYLVREDDGLTLIDANLKGSEKDILEAAQGVPIRRILLTHAHVDHVGAVDALVEQDPGSVLAASERSIPILKSPPDLTLRPGEVGSIRGNPPGIASSVHLVLSGGDRVGSLLVVDTPGHIHGHLSFLDERDGTFYAGDELFGLSHLGITGWAPWWFPIKAYSDRATARQTALCLLDLPIRQFATGDGPVRTGGRAALERAIALAK